MIDPSPPAARSSWNSPTAPLSLAAYITWLAIAVDPLRDLLNERLAFDARTLIGATGLVLQILLFVRRATTAPQGDDGAVRRLVLAQAAAALLAIWGLPQSGSMAVLLILVAAQMFAVYPLRPALLLTLAINAVLAALLIAHWGTASAIPALLSYGGFQAFAALTTTYARRAEEARDALRTINAELLATRQLLLESARGEERLRLSRELHDVAGHKLTALKLQLRMIEREVAEPQRTVVGDCMRLSDELLADVRGVVDTLRAHDGIDLHAALRALAPSLSRPVLRFELDAAARPATLDQAQALLRVAQEGLTNALRHAACTTIVLRLQRHEGGIELQIEDDGRAQSLPEEGNGLRGMRERLAALGGGLSIAVQPEGGLRLSAQLPVSP